MTKKTPVGCIEPPAKEAEMPPLTVGLAEAARILGVTTCHSQTIRKQSDAPAAAQFGRNPGGILYRVDSLNGSLRWPETTAPPGGHPHPLKNEPPAG